MTSSWFTQPAALELSYMNAVRLESIAVDAHPLVTSKPMSILDGRSFIQWRVFASDDPRGNIVEFKVGYPDPGYYIGLGFAKVSMIYNDGLVVICAFQSASGTSLCTDWQAENFMLFPRSVVPVTSAHLAPTGAVNITFRVYADTLGITEGRQRLMFCVANYDFDRNMPLMHSQANRHDALVNIYEGTYAKHKVNTATTASIVIIATICCLLLIVGAVMRYKRIILQPFAQRAVYYGVGALVCFFVVFYGIMCMVDNMANLAPWPIARATGDSAVLAFWFILYPVQKHLNIFEAATGTSFERQLSYHVLLAVVCLVFTTIHMIMMIVNLTMTLKTSTYVFTMVGTHPPLMGILSWLLMVIMVLPSLFLRRKAYWTLRLVHVLAIPTLVFAILHYHNLVFALIPPFVNYAADLICRGRSHVRSKATLTAAEYYKAGDFVKLTVQLSHDLTADAGAFAEIGFNSVGNRLNPHPFSIAWYTEATQEVTLFVKNMGPNTWTDDLCNAVRTDPVFPAHTRMTWQGPYGSLQVPLGFTPTVVLIAGGIGITPMLNLLRIIRRDTARKERDPKKLKIDDVLILWSLREEGLFEETKPFWDKAWRHTKPGDDTNPAHEPIASGTTPLTGPRLRVTGELFGSQLRLTDPAPFNAVNTRRVDIEQDVFRMLSMLYGNVDGPITLYCCGPQALMDMAEAYARARPKTWLHTETFEF